jgi:hypothetical protein
MTVATSVCGGVGEGGGGSIKIEKGLELAVGQRSQYPPAENATVHVALLRLADECVAQLSCRVRDGRPLGLSSTPLPTRFPAAGFLAALVMGGSWWPLGRGASRVVVLVGQWVVGEGSRPGVVERRHRSKSLVAAEQRRRERQGIVRGHQRSGKACGRLGVGGLGSLRICSVNGSIQLLDRSAKGFRRAHLASRQQTGENTVDTWRENGDA